MLFDLENRGNIQKEIKHLMEFFIFLSVGTFRNSKLDTVSGVNLPLSRPGKKPTVNG